MSIQSKAAIVAILAGTTASLGAAGAWADTGTKATAKPMTTAAPAAPAVQIPVGPLPRGLAGYAQPVIPPTACRVISPSEAQCAVPALTAGRYLIELSGTSSSPAAEAIQALEIDVGERQCGVAKNAKPWTTGARTFRMACEAILMTETPLTVRGLYADAKATKDPKGPTLSMRPLPWLGLLSAQPFVPAQ